MPWLSYYTMKLPAIGQNLNHLRTMAINRTAERYKNGSSLKDIFYYLVSMSRCSRLCFLTHLKHYTKEQ